MEVFFFYNSYRSEILQAYLGWYSTLPQYVSENSVEPLDFGEIWSLKIGHLHTFWENFVEFFETYGCSPANLQTYQWWYSTLPQYASKNSVELLHFGETLNFKNWPFSYILRELCISFWNYYSCSPAILQVYKQLNIFYSTTVHVRIFHGTITFLRRLWSWKSCQFHISHFLENFVEDFVHMALRTWWLVHLHVIHLSACLSVCPSFWH